MRAVAVQFFINGAVLASYVPRLPEVRDALNTDLSTIGQIITGASVAGLLGSWLSDRIIRAVGTRGAMIYGTIGLVICLPLIAYASSVWTLALVLAALMMVDVVVDIAMNMQGSAISARRSTPVMNRLHGLWSVGTVAGGSLAATMAALAVPLHWHLLGAAGVMLLGLWYIGGGLLKTDRKPQEAGDKTAQVRAKRAPLSLWIFGLLGATAFIPEMVAGDWSAFRLNDDLQAGAGTAALGFVAFSCGMVLGRLSGDWVAAKTDRGSLLKYATLIAGGGYVLACLIDSVPAAFIGFVLAGLGISVLFPSLYDAAAQDPHRPGAALGAITAASRIAMLVSPLMIGFLADTSLFSVGMAMIVMALPCLLIIGGLSRRAFGG